MDDFTDGTRLVAPNGLPRAGEDAEGGIPRVNSAGNALFAGVGMGDGGAIVDRLPEDVDVVDGGVDFLLLSIVEGKAGTGIGGGGRLTSAD